MRKFKTCSAAQFAVSFALNCGGRVAAARGFRPVRECRLSACIRFYDFERPRSQVYPLTWGSHVPAIETGRLSRRSTLESTKNDDGTPYTPTAILSNRG